MNDADTQIYVHGVGAVSPAGWSAAALLEAVRVGVPLPKTPLTRPGWAERGIDSRQVPAPKPRPTFLANPRLRRTSPISHFTVASALEAIGADAPKVATGEINLGIVMCMMSGCVNYSRRFYDETLRDPSTASPLVFPETVYNAPSSHLAALLGATGNNYTVVGDPGVFLHGLALGVDWLITGQANACLIVAAEENDWLTADAFRLFCKRMALSDGAGTLYLKTTPSSVRLECITDPHLYTQKQTRAAAVRRVRDQLPTSPGTLLCDGLQGLPRMDRDEAGVWADWNGPRLSIKRVIGEGLTASAAWQCIAAVDAIQRGHDAANVPVTGTNQQAIGARFVAS
jgi:hypothetical protein